MDTRTTGEFTCIRAAQSTLATATEKNTLGYAAGMSAARERRITHAELVLAEGILSRTPAPVRSTLGMVFDFFPALTCPEGVGRDATCIVTTPDGVRYALYRRTDGTGAGLTWHRGYTRATSPRAAMMTLD
jgi:hypothetical protein